MRKAIPWKAELGLDPIEETAGDLMLCLADPGFSSGELS